jgi:hypothetical protein
LFAERALPSFLLVLFQGCCCCCFLFPFPFPGSACLAFFSGGCGSDSVGVAAFWGFLLLGSTFIIFTETETPSICLDDETADDDDAF